MVSAYRGNEKIVVDKSALTRVAEEIPQLRTGLARCHLKDKHSGPCVAISIRDGNKGSTERNAPVKSWHDDGFSPFGINRLDVFYEPITPDHMLRCVKAGARLGQKESRVGGLSLLIDI